MTSVAEPILVPSTPPKPWLSRRMLVLAWLLALAALCFGLGRPPVQRTQEARVLETARQMRGTGLQGWLVPKINGNLRLQKPPLAYWMAALAYDVAGVGTTSGRFPTAVCGWLTLAVTYLTAKRLFGARAAFFAAATLLCSYLFFRHDRLAETDAPAALFVTLAIYAFIRALGIGVESRNDPELNGLSITPSSAALWFNLGAVATALAVLFKGGPGAFPPIFLLAIVALRRQWRGLLRFVTSGAPVLLLVLAVPWFIYAQHSTRSAQIQGEVDTLFSGQDHYAPFYHYAPELLKATLPWTFVALIAVFVAMAPIVQSRGEGRIGFRRWALSPQAAVLVWSLSVLVPLCVIGNKQFHYLLPLMPPLMILAGWLLDLATREATSRVNPVIGAAVDGTLFGTLLAVPGVVLAARKVLGHARSADWALAASILVAVMAVALVYLRRGRPAAVVTYLLACTLIFPAAVGLWMPSLEPGDSTFVARVLSDNFGEGPYVFYGPNYSLPLCFDLRSAIPSLKKPADLQEYAAQHPDVIVIAQTKSKYTPPPIPDGFESALRLATREQTFQIYRVRR